MQQVPPYFFQHYSVVSFASQDEGYDGIGGLVGTNRHTDSSTMHSRSSLAAGDGGVLDGPPNGGD